MAVITIRGQQGSGAPEIGRLLAWRLGFDYVDKDIIGMVASRMNVSQGHVALKENPPCTLMKRLVEGLSRMALPGLNGAAMWLPEAQDLLDDSTYVEALRATITALANGGSIVIGGRGSQFILRERADAFHILVVGNVEACAERIAATRGLDIRQARAEIARMDASRQEFIRRYFSAELENPSNYDLVLNTTKLDFDASVRVIMNALSQLKLTVKEP